MANDDLNVSLDGGIWRFELFLDRELARGVVGLSSMIRYRAEL